MPKPTSYAADDDVNQWIRQYAWAYNISISRVINLGMRVWWEQLDPKVKDFVQNYNGEDVEPPYVPPRHANRG